MKAGTGLLVLGGLGLLALAASAKAETKEPSPPAASAWEPCVPATAAIYAAELQRVAPTFPDAEAKILEAALCLRKVAAKKRGA